MQLVVRIEGGGVRGLIGEEVVVYVCFKGYVEEAANGGCVICGWED